MDKEKPKFETIKPTINTSETPISKQGPEEIKEKEGGLVDLSPEVLAFLRKHINIGIYPLKTELMEIRDFVKTLPPETQSSTRRTLIYNFKEKLKKTRENSAKAQVEIENFIRINPNTSRGALHRKVREIIAQNHLESQYMDFGLATTKFLDARDTVQGVVEKYQAKFGERWQKELFRSLFGSPSKGKIIVEILPASIYIRIFDIEDFILAFTSDSNSTESEARMSGGFKIDQKLKNLPELTKKVIIENSALSQDPNRSQKIRSHEEEHTIFDYYDPQLSRDLSQQKKLEISLQLTRGEIDYDMFKNIIDWWARTWVLHWEQQAKNEILAYLKDGRSPYAMLGTLTENDGLYNYFQQNDEIFQQRVITFVQDQKIVIKDRPMTENKIMALAHDVLSDSWQKYKETIKTALLAVERLIWRYQKSPEDKLKVIRLLSQEPLNKWRRLHKILS